MKNNLRHELLCYIGLITKQEKRFNYNKCLKTIGSVFGKHYKLTTLRKEFSLAKNEWLLEFKTHYRKSYPILSQKGRLLIKTRLSYKNFGPHDGKWRLVHLEFADSQKDKLFVLDKLGELGFVKLGRNLFISPYPILNSVENLAKNYGFKNKIKLFEASHLRDEDTEIKKAWDLENINQNYKKWLSNAKIKPNLYWPLEAKKLEMDFSEIYALDPHLPEKFLPKNWHGELAYHKFKEIANSY